jgi:hypothetical protein
MHWLCCDREEGGRGCCCRDVNRRGWPRHRRSPRWRRQAQAESVGEGVHVCVGWVRGGVIGWHQFVV